MTSIQRSPNQKRGQIQRLKRDNRKHQQAEQSKLRPQLISKDPKQQIQCLKGQLCIQLNVKKTNKFKV